jgi:hypothetical protein
MKVIAMDSQFRTRDLAALTDIGTGVSPVLRDISVGQAFPPTLNV